MFSGPIQYLLEQLKAHQAQTARDRESLTIHVDEIAAKIARFYEHIRNVVDYREEHLLRKRSIHRALQRGLMVGATPDFAETLVKEIIRSGHLPNDKILEDRIPEIAAIIRNLRIRIAELAGLPATERAGFSAWLVRIAACAIEETLDPPVRDRIMGDAMFLTLKERLTIKGAVIPEDEKLVQIFIGIERALLRVDEDQLSWRLLNFLYPGWGSFTEDGTGPVPVAPLPQIKRVLDAHIGHKLGPQFFAICSRYNTVFLLLGDALFSPEHQDDPEGLLRDDAKLRGAIGAAYGRRYEQQRKRMRRIALLTMLSLFITKVVLALAVEIPIDRYLTHEFSLVNTGINILFPPFLMLLILSLIRLPSEKNLQLVQEEARSAVYERHRKHYLMVVSGRRSGAVTALVWIIYLIVSALVLWGVWRLLSEQLQFSEAGVFVFVLFTSIVAATGVRVQNRSKEISMEERKPSFVGFLADLIFMPFVTLGQAVIGGLARFRFLAVLVDLIDAPFQVFVIFIENFNEFLRSKKEELH